jgi:superfamily II DNA or RNA helicase
MTLDLFQDKMAKKSAPPVVLRPYQQAADERVIANLADGRSTLVVMATGLGKTVLFSNRARAVSGGVLVLAHRKTLLQQARATLEKMTGERVGLEQGDSYAGQERIVVASKDSLHPDRLQRRYRPGDFELVIVDEAHRAVSGSYVHIFEYFDRAKVLGVTATPDRADEKALGEVFDSVSYVYEIGDAIGDGWLVPLEVHRARLDVDLSRVKTTAGDFNAGELDEAMQSENEGVAHHTLEVAAGRRSVVFTTSVNNAAVLAETFNKRAGGCARYISGDMDEAMKAGLISDHKAGRFQVLINVDVLTEGYDDPELHVIAMGRPTKSRIRYAQAIGRGTRPLPGVVDGLDTAEARIRAIAESAKSSCTILDFVGNTGRLVKGGKVISLVGPEDILGGKYSDAEVEEAKEIAEREPGIRADEALDKARATIEERNRKAKEAQLFRAKNVRASSSQVDPFSVFGIKGGEDWGGRFDAPASQAQRETLKKLGVEFPDKMSKNAAHKLISAAFKRREVGLASFKQLRLIAKHVPGAPANLTFSDARKVIDSIVKQGWRSVGQDGLAILDGYRAKGKRRAS